MLRVLRAVPGVQGAQEPRLRHGDRLGRQHGTAEEGRRRKAGDGSTGHAGRHDEIGGGALALASGDSCAALVLCLFGDSCAAPLCRRFSSLFWFVVLWGHCLCFSSS